MAIFIANRQLPESKEMSLRFRLKNVFVCSLLSAGIVACTSTPHLEKLTAATDRQSRPESQFYGSVAINDVRVENEANPAGREKRTNAHLKDASPESFRHALENSLRDAKMLALEPAEALYSVDASLLYSESVGTSFTTRVNTAVLFTVMSGNDSEPILAEIISGSHQRSLSYRLTGAADRNKIAFEESIRECLGTFINQLLDTNP